MKNKPVSLRLIEKKMEKKRLIGFHFLRMFSVNIIKFALLSTEGRKECTGSVQSTS